MSTGRVVSSAQKTATAADRLGRRFARLLARVLRETERRLKPLVSRAAHGDRTAIVQAGQASRLRTDLRQALTASGYDDLAVAATSAPLDRITESVLRTRRLARLSGDLVQGTALRLEALKALYQQDLLELGDELAHALWQTTVRGVFGTRPVEALLADLEDVLDTYDPNIRTLYDTSVSIYGRQVEALQAGDAPETTFAYFGPVDDVTRDFCLKHVGRVYTRDEIDELDNGQLDNVFLTGGGYNCRHVWTEVSQFSEVADIGRKRVPEVQAQLDELREAA